MNEEKIIKEFIKGTPAWHKAFAKFIDTSEPCTFCGIIPDNLLKLSEALKNSPLKNSKIK